MKCKPVNKWIVIGVMTLFNVNCYALTAEQMIEKMAYSAKTQSYKGYFFYQQDQINTSYKIVHWVDGNIEKQRLQLLDGSAYEVINDGHSLKCLHAGDVGLHANDMLHLNQSPVDNSSLSTLWQNYTAAITGVTRVADHLVTKVQLTPRDQHRFPFIFYIDNATGLMLKMQVLNLQGQLLEQFSFVMIHYEHVVVEDLKPQIKNYRVVQHSKLPQNVIKTDHRWRLSWIPPGFTAENFYINSRDETSKDQQIFLYADGLNTFSVFVEPVQNNIATDTSTQAGSTSAISHYRLFNEKMFLVTVVGEIPIMTAKQIALSVEPSS